MEFFNQKEEVIDIQLTQYGKRQLAAGAFKPVFYAFYDKDILYNAGFGGVSEHQNAAETRIKDETPRLKVQHNFVGVETQFQALKEIIEYENSPKSMASKSNAMFRKEKLQEVENKFFGIGSTIGTTKLKNRYQPSWQLKFYKGNLSSSLNTFTGSGQVQTIPQLTSQVTYTSYATNDPDEVNFSLESLGANDIHSDKDIEPIVFEDDSVIIIEDDYILIAIDENNTQFENENFEVEVFMEETNPTTNIVNLTPLLFAPNTDSEGPGGEEFTDEPSENPIFVEYYFNLLIDDDIPEEILCKNLDLDDKKTLYVRSLTSCDDIKEKEIVDIYEDDEIGDVC